MARLARIGIDTSKSVFQLHGVEAGGPARCQSTPLTITRSAIAERRRNAAAAWYSGEW